MRRLFVDTPSWIAYGLFAFVACASAGIVLALVALTGPTDSTAAAVRATPTAAEFGHDFVATANAYAAAHASARRLTSPHCVQAAPGRYMCAYAVTSPGRALDCHLMQARWTPEGPSTFTVTLAGRAARCESIRAAIRSLR